MTKPLSEQLRLLLRHMKQRCLERHEAFAECEQEFAKRRDTLAGDWAETRRLLDESLAQDQAALLQEWNDAQQRITTGHDEEYGRLTNDYEAGKAQAQDQYDTEKAQAVSELKENRWETTTLNDSDKKVARDQLRRSQHQLKEGRAKLKGAYLDARRLVRSWEFARGIDVFLNYQPRLNPADPWKNFEQRYSVVFDCLRRLHQLRLPRLLQGQRLLLATFIAWLVLSVPAFLIDAWYYWLPASTVAVVLGGWGLRRLMRRSARRQAALLWQGLAQAFLDARVLRRLSLDQAVESYRTARANSRAEHGATLHQIVDRYKQRKHVLQAHLEQQIQQLYEEYRLSTEQIAQKRDQNLVEAQETYETAHPQRQAKYDEDLSQAEARARTLKEENEHRHLRERKTLIEGWRKTCAFCDSTLTAIEKECRQSFPPWEEEQTGPPSVLPNGLPFGTLNLSAALFPHAEPEDAHLPRLRLIDAVVPALLPFPDRASVLFKAVDDGREVGVRVLEALLLRAWTSLPPGKLRCTIIDPVGRGENFSAFMHLADQDDALINSRIWTETSHIDDRLADMTTHMETVLQKFLRNRYQTLAEYNAQAGEVAEPFRLLVVAHFPVNFSTDAARRLVSLANAGARCGIFTLVMVDARQEMPHGVELADLEAACINLVWREGKFNWRDPDFGDFPLTLTMPPAAAMCTRILTDVGEKAKLANRVEVPFESIAPKPAELWTADSRAGIAVPLGRAGAMALQMLALGKGTSQHVLVAGKTGSGKSTLLHVLITQLALHYSPREVELYLIDFKKGVEFKTYASHHLPHARVVAVESEREFGLSVLQRLDAELVRRGEIFRQAGVNDLPGYRETVDRGPWTVDREPESTVHGPRSTVHDSLPRILLIVDEFQEFFIEDDKLAQEAALLLDRLVRQGRAFGVHVILGSQTLGGAYSLARSTIDQMAVRIALQCSEADAHLILSKENSEARLLSRPGEAIYNAANGLLEGNNLFQVVWITDERRDAYLAMIQNLAKRNPEFPQPETIVFEGSAPSLLSKNPWLTRTTDERRAEGRKPPDGRAVPCWLGEAVAIKDPTAAVFHRQSGANLLMVGQQGETAFNLMVASLVSLAAYSRQLPVARRQLPLDTGHLLPATGYWLLATGYSTDSDAFLQKLPELLPVRLVLQRDLPDLMGSLSEELQQRQKDAGEREPIFLFLHGLQRLRELRRPDDEFTYSRHGDEKPSPAKQFQTLLREGPPLGIFTIVWCDTLTNLHRCIDRQGLREFEMRVLFPMNSADSSNLMDSPLASKLGSYRAFFYSEDQGKMEKFRPYGLPTPDWLKKFVG